MPKYCYHCNNCELEWEEWHAMDEKVICVDCDSDNIERIPQLIQDNKVEKRSKVGDVVNKFIKDAKEDLREMKKEIKGKDLEL